MRSILCFVLVLLFYTNSKAAVKLPRLISNGMVLQRDQAIRIWGWADQNESIKVSLDHETYETIADANGDWHIQIKPHKAGGPFKIQIKASNNIELNDILFGDVWVCSGQSNMELWMGRLKYKYADEIKNANNPSIRQFLVTDKYDFKKAQNDFSAGEWLAVNPNTILDFSGVAYFFAKEINAQYHIPIGIINSALGGSPAQSWISEEGLKNFPNYLNDAITFKNDQLIQQVESKDQKISNAWYQYINTFDEGILHHWSAYKTETSNWKDITIPGLWTKTNLKNVNGVVWFRKNFVVPKTMLDKPTKLELGRIVDADSVFINGVFVGSTGYQYPPRRYELNSTVLKEGVNNITVKVISNAGNGGFVLDKKYELTTATDTISLAGNWKYQLGIATTALPSPTFIRWKPIGLYNAMIAPLTSFAIKGFLWYQGESNAGHPSDYDQLMQTLILDWRNKWNNANLPFLYVQLPNFMEPSQLPKESGWADLRQEQFKTLAMPQTAMAVAIDLGEWNDIHPENKLDVAHRLALLARKNVYGEKKLVAQGPLFKNATILNDKLIVSFNEIGSGLMAIDGKALQQFQIAGVDKKFVWANAKIVNNQVEVWNSQITHPIYVRYAWADNPDGANLYNKEGLPAAPFTNESEANALHE